MSTIKSITRYDKPCPHEGLPVSKAIATLPDYHPLSHREVLSLLRRMGEDSADVSKASSAQVRLCQGVPGMTCPRPIDNEIAAALSEVDEVFVKYYYGRLDLDVAARKISQAYARAERYYLKEGS